MAPAPFDLADPAVPPATASRRLGAGAALFLLALAGIGCEQRPGRSDGQRLAERLRKHGGAIASGIDDEAKVIAQLSLRSNADETLLQTEGYAIRCLVARSSDVAPAALARFLAERGQGLVGLDVAASLLPKDFTATFERLPALEWLLLAGDGDLGDLAALRQCARLRALRFGGAPIGVLPLDLTFVDSLPELQELALWGPARAFGSLASCRNLRSLEFGSQDATRETLAVLAGLPELRRLRLSGDSAIAREAFEPLEQTSSLRHLFLSGIPLGDEVLPTLARCRGLEELWLDGTGISALRPLGSLPQLRILGVRGTAIDVDDVRDLAGLATLEHLIADRPILDALGDPAALFPAWRGSELLFDDVIQLDAVWREVVRLRNVGR